MLLATLTVLAFTAVPSDVSAGRGWTYSISNTGSGSGVGMVRAYTTEDGTDNLPDDSVQSEAWITNTSATKWCFLNSASGGSFCYKWGASDALAGQQSNGFGTYNGHSKHWAIRDNNWYIIDQGSVTIPAGYPDGDPPPSDDPPPNEDPPPDECGSECNWSPILIPLTRSQSYKLTSAFNGVNFDLDVNGVIERTAWTAEDSKLAFLAMDRNNNGLIDDGSELFGNRTLPGINDGFHALQKMNHLLRGDTVDVSFIDSDQPLYAKLLLWEDSNHNGVSEASELQPASNVLSQISMGYGRFNRRDGHGNEFRYRGSAYVRTAPGPNKAAGNLQEELAREIYIFDVFFVR